MPVEIRIATAADASGVARVQVSGWHAAYRGLIHDDFLATFTEEARTARWKSNLANGPFTTLIAVESENVIGFSSHGPSREPDAPAEQGELLALYVLPTRWRGGLGGQLLAASEAALSAAGHTESILWVLDGNDRAIAFYEAAGYQLDGARKQLALGAHMSDELRMRRRL